MRPIPVDTAAFFHRGPSPARAAGVFRRAVARAAVRRHALPLSREHPAGRRHRALSGAARACRCPARRLHTSPTISARKRELADENAMLKQELVARAPADAGLSRAVAGGERAAARRCSTCARSTRRRRPRSRCSTRAAIRSRRSCSSTRASSAGIVAGRAVDRRERRRRPGDARVSLHGGSDARSPISDQAVPVQVERSGARSVLFGNGTGRSPELRFMSPSADIAHRRPAA